jgi:hypothetical protein
MPGLEFAGENKRSVFRDDGTSEAIVDAGRDHIDI